jgi:hypothetical protein
MVYACLSRSTGRFFGRQAAWIHLAPTAVITTPAATAPDPAGVKSLGGQPVSDGKSEPLFSPENG